MSKSYSCPMHPEISQTKPGFCSKCGMALESSNQQKNDDRSLDTYAPLLVIISLIAGVVLLSNWRFGLSLTRTMELYMAGFFLIFSGFKLIDLPGFAHGYARYDPLAKKVRIYGFVYPFLELGLGLSFLLMLLPTVTLGATILLMLFSGAGVAISLRQQSSIKCACLGTAIKLPLGTVTLIENFGMAAMAGLMLIL